ncbi:alpha-2-macroglobulin family protein [Paludibacter sp.]|uniref:alpha-2-macroglobulin family protein n=1 Tax=Paludibacter sp. TaxID=1898105 RepID=UPI001353FDC8|nr:alpha-2-macroglobulin family protein [Paludibacter sp.]MTK52029.1 hypothetical protein [Paludibacter sp.]
MKQIRFSFILIGCFIFLSVTANSFNYAKQWERIAAFESKSRPQSALQAVDSLMNAAKIEKNSPQFLKGWLYRFRFLMEKVPDSFSSELQAMEAYTAKTKNNTEQAVLHSLLAKLYTQYYQQHSYTINRRTKLTKEIPTDIKEWSANIFADTIAYHVKASLANASLLQSTNALIYEAIMEIGADSRTLQPTLFDFLCARSIETLSAFADNPQIDNQQLNDRKLFEPASTFILQTDTGSSYKGKILNIYRQWLTFRLKNNNEAALIYTDLERLNYIYQNTSLVQKDDLYLNALQQLRQEHSTSENIVEVMAAIANYYLQHDEYDKERANETARFLDYKKRAFDICAEGIQRFPKYKRINVLKAIQQQITERTIKAENPEVIASKSPLKIKLSSANVSQIEIRLYRIDMNTVDYYKSQQRASRNQITKGAVLMETQKISLKPSSFFRETDTTIVVKTPSYGIYEYCVSEPGSSNPDKQVCGKFAVSDLAYFTRTKQEGMTDMYVVDRVSGHPLEGVSISAFTQNGYGEKMLFSQTGTFMSDSNGHCEFASPERYGTFIQLANANDKYFPVNSVSSYFYAGEQPENKEPRISLFTDRAIYRPGQTIYFKGIVWLATRDSSQVIPGKNYSIALRDANRQEVSTQAVKTNDFGSFSGSFTLPKGRLNGDFSLNIENKASISFAVEEYKRPTFEITFDTIKGTPAFGDKVTIRGNVRSYADFPIEKASVKYRVVRRPHWLMHWLRMQDQEILNGELKSNEKGQFDISFIPQKQDETPAGYKQFYTYSVATEITDTNGETQKNEMSFSVGDISMYLTADTKEIVDKAKPFDIGIAAFNLNDAPVKTTVSYTLSRLKPDTEYTEKAHNEDLTNIEQQLLSGNIDTGNEKKISIAHPEKWESGKYLIKLSAKDEQGRLTEVTKTFILYSPDDKKLPIKRYCWIQELKTSCEPGETADILFGTSAPDARVLYELMDGNKILESKWMTFDNEMRHLKIPFKKEYDRGITMVISLIRDEKNFSEIIPIRRAQRNTKLEPKFSIFRSKLTPNTKEEWKIIIPKYEDKYRQAECMISMYDASLDIFRENSWRFFPKYYYSVPQTPRWSYLTGNTFIDYINYQHAINQITPPTIILDNYATTDIALSPRQRKLKSSAKSEEVFTIVEEMPQFKGIANSSAEKKQDITPRKNFAETAFFYPQLRTDENGEVSFSFTVPESLTRWKVMGLAHTKDLYFGQWSAQTVTQKQFMVQPNMPRFVRESDTLTITAKLVNLSDKRQAGNARLELTDPETNQTLPAAEANRPFVAEQNGSTMLAWKIAGFAGKQMLICKVTASTDEFSDGEEHYLPVLPDKLRVTETFPFRVRTKQTKEFTFERLKTESSKVDSKSLTLEMTANPTWYALQALPTLSLPNNDCLVSWFSTYYANTLAAAIAKSDPKTAETFRQWQQSGNALQSNLEKDEELKNLLLTETPWVLEAKSESAQKQRIAELFDANRQADNRRQAMETLSALQLSNGAFTWFKGMSEDRFLTQYILEGMARLTRMGAESYLDKEQEMIRKALRYTDQSMVRDFEEMKKYDKEWKKRKWLSPDQIYYFYMRSSYHDIATDKEAEEAVDFFKKLLAANWTDCTLFGKALIAVTAQRYGDKKLAADIVKSLEENATTTDEKGMFWQNNRSGLWWHESDIATQTAIIEALTEINSNAQQTDDMRFWLLSQKQTERWHSPIATADAVYALLMNGSDWLSGKNDVQVKLGKQVVTSNVKEAGTGYFKTTFTRDEIKPAMAEISVKNNETHPAWGALYWQYETTLNNVTAQKGTQLNVDKKLYIEQSSPTGPVLTPVSKGSALKVGDKMTVRLVVTTDRDMEYVALTDQRAACLEPTEQLSGCRWKERVCYYQSTKDASTQFFFSFLPKGTYVFEYSTWITRSGTYSNGIATIQCQYAPDFSAHSASQTITIK